MKKMFWALLGTTLMVIMSTSVLGQNIDFQLFNEGEKTKYFTKGHPKAKGVNISIEYPSRWSKTEGERPNVVQKFSGDASDGITRMFLILINDAPKALSLFSDEDLANEIFSKNALIETVPEGGRFINGEQTKYDGQPGAWIIYSIDMQRAGMAIRMYTLQHMFFFRENGYYTMRCWRP